MDTRRTVLVVDDHELVRSLLVDVLEDAGFDVLSADSGSSALEIVAGEAANIDCIIQDMSMPVMSGRETIQRTLEIEPSARIIVLSVDDEATVRAELRDLQFAGYLAKPCDADELVRVVQQTIA